MKTLPNDLRLGLEWKETPVGEGPFPFVIPRKGAGTKTIAIVGKKGSGKTWTAAVWVEQLLAAKVPVVILDPVGRWWDLGVSPNGTGAGFPIAIFGGKRGQVALTPDIGAAIARYVSARHVPTVVDLSFESKAAWRRIVADFADELFRVNETPIMVVIEEAPEFIPQRVMGESAVVFGAVDRLVRLGRNHGIGVTAIGQRLQTINKDTLSQVDALILMRLIDPQGREAARKWAEGKGEAGAVEDFVSELAALPTGEAFIWSPEWLECFARVKIEARTTFHYDPETETAGGPASIARAVDTTELVQDFAKFQKKAGTTTVADVTDKSRTKAAGGDMALVRKVESLEAALEAAQAQVISDEDMEARILHAVETATNPLRQRVAQYEGLLSSIVQQAQGLLGDGALVSDSSVLAAGVAAPQRVSAYVAKQSEFYQSKTVTTILNTLAENYLRFHEGMTAEEIATEAGYAPVGRFLGTLYKLAKRRVLVKEGGRFLLNPAHLK